MDKAEIRKRGLETGADVVGFAAIEDYHSKKSPDPKTLLPGVRSMVVLGYREVHGSLESPNKRMSMMSRMGTMDLSKSSVYRLAKLIEDRCKVNAVPVLASYPLDMGLPVMGLAGDLSLRHAAIAAGLGVFGRHNLVIHPRFGTRIVFTAILTELPLESDPPVRDELCDNCMLCVENCPARALDTEGKTEQMKCLRVSQPYGIGGVIGFIRKLMKANPEEQKAMLVSPEFMHLYQASFIGFQYNCFECMTCCPAGLER